MNLGFHLPGLPDCVWTDEAIKNLVGQETKVAGCPAKIIDAYRCSREDQGVDITVKLDNAFDSYIDFVKLFKRNELEGISLKPEVKDGKKKK